MNYFNVLLQVAIYWTTVITNWQFFVVSLPHELFQFVASSCHLLNNYDHKLRICGFFYIMNYIFYYVASSCDLLKLSFCLISFPHELIWQVVSSCHLLNNYYHKLSICGISFPNELIWCVAKSCHLLNTNNYKTHTQPIEFVKVYHLLIRKSLIFYWLGTGIESRRIYFPRLQQPRIFFKWLTMCPHASDRWVSSTKGAFTNYVDKKRWLRSPKMLTFCPFL